jgi:hypothetical protein
MEIHTIMKKLVPLILLLTLFQQIQAQNLEELGDFDERKFLDIKGSLTLGSNLYFTTSEQQRQNPFGYIVSGAPVLAVYGIPIPLSFTFANADFAFQGPSFEQFRRVGMSPYYKWVKVHAGYRNISFSPYTLNGHNFLGGGFEITPGKWRVGFVYGRFQSAVEEDTTAVSRLPAQYKRTGYAFKVGYGDQQNFVELSVLKAKDDPNSIATPVQSDITPAENLAIGLSTRVSLVKNLTWDVHLGASAYTEDLFAPELATEDRVPSMLTSLFQPYASTRMNYAGHTSLRYSGSFYSIGVEYRRVDPEYQTMGSYFFNNDLERYSIQPSLNLFQSRLNLSGSIGIQRDNLLDDKASTTRRTIGSANVQYNILPELNLAVNYSNFATEQQSGLVALNDTIRVYQVTHNVAVTPSYYIAGDRFYQNFVLNLSNQSLIDRNIFTSDFTESQTNSINFNYSLRDNIVNYGINFGLNYLTLNSMMNDIVRYGFSTGVEKSLWEEKMTVSLNGLYNLSSLNGNDDGYVTNGTLNINYTPHPRHAFSLRGQAIFNRTGPDEASELRYEDYIINVNYNFTL